MRFGLPTALACAAFSFALSAPAQAAQTFNFDTNNPLTLTTQADGFNFSFDAQSRTMASDAGYSLAVSFLSSIDNRVHTYTPTIGMVPYGSTKSEFFQYFSNGPTETFFFTFTALGNYQAINLTNVQGSLIKHGSPTFLSFAVVPNVPEPATWLMMLVGFATIGAAARGRYRSVAIA